MAKVWYFIYKMQPLTIYVYYCVVIWTDELRFGIVKLQIVAGGILTADVQHNS